MKRPCESELDCSPPTQAIRLVDVFLLGPAMVAIGVRSGTPAGAFVGIAGLCTIAFNGHRYIRARRRRRF